MISFMLIALSDSVSFAAPASAQSNEFSVMNLLQQSGILKWGNSDKTGEQTGVSKETVRLLSGMT